MGVGCTKQCSYLLHRADLGMAMVLEYDLDIHNVMNGKCHKILSKSRPRLM